MTSADAPFFEGLATGELRMQRCTGCRTWTWPAQWRCGRCGAWDLGWEAIPMRGEVHSFVRTYHVFRPELRERTPYVSLLVSLPDAGGLRLLGLLEGTEDGLAVDAPVEGFVEATGEGSVLRWRLAGGGQ